MTARLTVDQTSREVRVIRIEGYLSEAALSELDGLIRGERPTLDVSGLRGLDESSLAYLAGLWREGCRLVGASPYVAQLLAEAGR